MDIRGFPTPAQIFRLFYTYFIIFEYDSIGAQGAGGTFGSIAPPALLSPGGPFGLTCADHASSSSRSCSSRAVAGRSAATPVTVGRR
jgi:hypothetical protein